MITSEEPKVSKNGKYGVMQACRALGIHRNTLYRYRDNNLIKEHRSTNGRSYYVGAELLRLWYKL